MKILWHVDPLLDNDREVSKYTTAVTRQRHVNSKRKMVLSVRSVPRSYKQNKLRAFRGLLRFGRCELLLLDAGCWGWEQFENSEQGQCPSLEAATKQLLVMTVTGWGDLVCPIVICEVWRTVRAQSLLTLLSCKSSVNSITNQNLVYSH
jgi:hypothetical protein